MEVGIEIIEVRDCIGISDCSGGGPFQHSGPECKSGIRSLLRELTLSYRLFCLD
jgi:hypothetical protein